jgi:prolyl oligopeptidase
MLVVGPPGALDERVARPTILHGYGGFNISATPTYSAMALAWVEAGGVYVEAAVRGGGEEGRAWHRAGMLESKPNTFADFEAVAEYLVSAGWTAPAQLCAFGCSNGGLLVGAAITRRPELFGAALCQAPLLDMVRYERFGLGRMWTGEYGSVADAEQFTWLQGYSPYHQVRAATAYPAVLFTTFDGDTRVDPMHARKMCAALQHATAATDRAVLLRREPHMGHGINRVSSAVAVDADMLAFAAAHTGLRL